MDSQKFNNHYTYSGGGAVAGARKTDNLVNMEAPKINLRHAYNPAAVKNIQIMK
jgi:hypothetical protein